MLITRLHQFLTRESFRELFDIKIIRKSHTLRRYVRSRFDIDWECLLYPPAMVSGESMREWLPGTGLRVRGSEILVPET